MSNPKMPNIWGEGKLFAFSGLDGETDWAHTLVASATEEPLGLCLHLNPDVMLTFAHGVKRIEARVVLGDAVDLTAETAEGTGELRFVIANHRMIIGEVTGALSAGPATEQRTGAGHLVIRVVEKDGVLRFCVALAPEDASEARAASLAGLLPPLDEMFAPRSAFVRGLDCSDLAEAADERTYRKCAEVLKLNARAPEGHIRRLWTTPDVWPHRHMWLWDSAFHALGWIELDEEMARDCLLAVIEAQLPDGRIPLCDAPEPMNQRHSQPPILAWAAWRVYERTGDDEFLAACYQPLCDFIEWWFRERDVNGNGLLEWLKEFEVERCRCGESGWDNSPRFDREIVDDHVDLNSYAVREMRLLAKMAEALGRDEVKDWRHRADELAALMNERLWNEELGLYLDRGPGDEGEWMLLKTAADFLPLIAGVPDAAQAERLVAHLTDPDEFWAPLPVPTVAMDEPDYADDMWRGPTWLNLNYLFWEGLKLYG